MDGMTDQPVPQRLSDADRDAAVEALRSHLEAGRLDQSEFDERMSAALAARVASDVMPLFGDLPLPHPQLGDGLPLAQPPGWAAPAAVGWTPPASPQPYQYQTPGQPNYGQELEKVRTGMLASLSPQTIDLLRTWTWPAAILIALITGNWITIPIAIVISVVLGQIGKQHRKPPPYLGK